MYRITVESLRDLLLNARNNADVPIGTLIEEAKLTEVPDGASDTSLSTEGSESASDSSSEYDDWFARLADEHGPHWIPQEVKLADFKAQLAIHETEIGFVYEPLVYNEDAPSFRIVEVLSGEIFQFDWEDFDSIEKQHLMENLFFGPPRKKDRIPCNPKRVVSDKPNYDGDPEQSPRALRDKLRFIYQLRHAKDGVVPPGLQGLRLDEIDFDREGYYTVSLPGDGNAYLYHRDKQLYSVQEQSLPRLQPRKRRLGVRPSRLRRYNTWKANQV